MAKRTEITIEALEKGGWVKTDDQAFPMEKKLENINPLNASEDSDIKLVIHTMYNTQTFAVALPDGGLLNFSISCLEELIALETSLQFYDPPF